MILKENLKMPHAAAKFVPHLQSNKKKGIKSVTLEVNSDEFWDMDK